MFGFGERFADGAGAAGSAAGTQFSFRFETAAGADGHGCFVPQYLLRESVVRFWPNALTSLMYQGLISSSFRPGV